MKNKIPVRENNSDKTTSTKMARGKRLSDELKKKFQEAKIGKVFAKKEKNTWVERFKNKRELNSSVQKY